MRNLTVDPEIAAIIGEQRAAELEAGPYPVDYRCVRCHRGGRVNDGEALAAGLDVTPGRMRLWFVHTACGPAEVVVFDQRQPYPEETEATGVLYAGNSRDGLPWACVVIELTMSVELLDDPAEVGVDQVLGVALARGMRPTADPLTPPEPDGPISWRVQLPRPGRHGGGVYGRNRLQLISPLPPMPPGWLDLVAVRDGRCGLYVVSRLGLLAVLDDLGTALTDAARAGRLVGTTAAVIR
ncbi:hypothetical protein ACGFI9_21850 [Micromonospora sp. NPDC048930]|uniref:hypothetical protein n=1 Tax=Micromonospora sp. NPDC048930 TaxID=3364261 RepID=UPI0037106066